MSVTGPSLWDLHLQGRNEEALAGYLKEFERTGHLSSLRNRAGIFIELGAFAEALEECQRLRSLEDPNSRGDADAVREGICHWWLDQPGLAVECFRYGLSAGYTNTASVMAPSVLLYAGLRLNDGAVCSEAKRVLRSLSRPKSIGYPRLIAPLLLGRATKLEIVRLVERHTNPKLLGRARCQSDFYLSIDALQRGNMAGFEDHCRRCAGSPHSRLEQEEASLARWEIDRGFPATPFP
ncbi:MAG TPA: hypothetical protein VGD10_12450 [Allosphingosinicella sp.]|uniref:hypothetical protein n=1 Tax=Allosphingosinicella sp. TaxID=2823234 RepID=UPI002ED7D8DC